LIFRSGDIGHPVNNENNPLEEEFPICQQSQASTRKTTFPVEICRTLVRKSLDDRNDYHMQFDHIEEAVKAIESHYQTIRLDLDHVGGSERKVSTGTFLSLIL
jgi:hypothetical protein